MFYSGQILSKGGPLQVVWMAAHMDRNLKRQQVDETNIDSSVDTILHPYNPTAMNGQEPPMALRLTGQLLLGVVRVFNHKVHYLQQDCENALSKLDVVNKGAIVHLAAAQRPPRNASSSGPPKIPLDPFSTLPTRTNAQPEGSDFMSDSYLDDEEEVFGMGSGKLGGGTLEREPSQGLTPALTNLMTAHSTGKSAWNNLSHMDADAEDEMFEAIPSHFDFDLEDDELMALADAPANQLAAQPHAADLLPASAHTATGATAETPPHAADLLPASAHTATGATAERPPIQAFDNDDPYDVSSEEDFQTEGDADDLDDVMDTDGLEAGGAEEKLGGEADKEQQYLDGMEGSQRTLAYEHGGKPTPAPPATQDAPAVSSWGAADNAASSKGAADNPSNSKLDLDTEGGALDKTPKSLEAPPSPTTPTTPGDPAGDSLSHNPVPIGSSCLKTAKSNKLQSKAPIKKHRAWGSTVTIDAAGTTLPNTGMRDLLSDRLPLLNPHKIRNKGGLGKYRHSRCAAGFGANPSHGSPVFCSLRAMIPDLETWTMDTARVNASVSGVPCTSSLPMSLSGSAKPSRSADSTKLGRVLEEAAVLNHLLLRVCCLPYASLCLPLASLYSDTLNNYMPKAPPSAGGTLKGARVRRAKGDEAKPVTDTLPSAVDRVGEVDDEAEQAAGESVLESPGGGRGQALSEEPTLGRAPPSRDLIDEETDGLDSDPSFDEAPQNEDDDDEYFGADADALEGARCGRGTVEAPGGPREGVHAQSGARGSKDNQEFWIEEEGEEEEEREDGMEGEENGITARTNVMLVQLRELLLPQGHMNKRRRLNGGAAVGDATADDEDTSLRSVSLQRHLLPLRVTSHKRDGRMQAARAFYDALVLKNRGFIGVYQATPFGDLVITAGEALKHQKQ